MRPKDKAVSSLSYAALPEGLVNCHLYVNSTHGTHIQKPAGIACGLS